VLLEARIVEVTLGNDSQIGVDWNGLLSAGAASGSTGTDIRGTFATGMTSNTNLDAATEGLAKLVVQNARITATLSALAREGRLQVLSSPRISTLNNQKAILRVVREEAFFLQNSQTTGSGGIGGFSTTVNITPMVVPVGIVLDILPQIADDNTVTLAVNPSISEIVAVRSLVVQGVGNSGGASATLPVVDRRDLDAVVRLKSGETLVLAGIIRSKEGVDDRGVPWIRKIPFLGNFFTKKEKTKTHTELAIFITPTLIDDSEQIAVQRDSSEKRLEKAGANLKPEPQTSSSIKEP
jgi:MSHA biogenesis protein MshL